MNELLTAAVQAGIIVGVLAAVCAAIWQDGQHGVPGMDEPYAATEPDEDARYEYEREAAAEANEGWR